MATPKKKTGHGENFETIAASSRNKKPVSEKEEAQRDERNEAVRQSAAQLAGEKAIQEVTALNMKVSGTLAGIQGDLLQAVQQLETVNEAVRLGREELQNTHNIDVVVTTIDDLVAQHDAKKAELERDVNEARAEWNREQEERDRDWGDDASKHVLDQTRATKEWNYVFTQQQQKARDDLAEEQRKARLAEQIRKEEIERTWAQREQELKSREQELLSLRVIAEQLPTTVKAEVGKAEKIVENSIKREYEHRIALLMKDHESATRANTIELSGANSRINTLVQEGSALREQLLNAQNKVAEIASEALKSASSDRAFTQAKDFLVNTQNSGQKPKAKQ